MKKMKKLLALGLAVAMSASLMACGGGDTTPTPTTETPATETPATTTPAEGEGSDISFGQQVEVAAGAATQDGRIDMGGWWQPYYFSSDDSVESDPSYSGTEKAHLKWDRLKLVEEKYGMPIYFNNLTYDGNLESINTSIIAGSPDMDIYMMDMNKAVTAQFSGLTLDLRTILPADHDIFTTQNRLRYVDLLDGKATLFTYVDEEDVTGGVYALAFNLQMLEANNLERPDVLWERGEWTWDKFQEYMIALTQDTNGDGQIDQYGFCGYVGDFLSALLMSNGTVIAGGPTENLSSNEVGEVLQFISDMYTTWNVCYPYDNPLANPDATPWETMRRVYREGNIAFFPIAVWIAAESDYNWDGNSDSPLNFDTVWVRWPVGPSGNQETNAGKLTTVGNIFMLPANVAEPELVFNYMDDYWNWYDGDLDLRKAESSDWWYIATAYEEELQNHNYDVQYESGLKGAFDVWENIIPDGMWDAVNGLIDGTVTPAQLQESMKNGYQANLDIIFK